MRYINIITTTNTTNTTTITAKVALTLFSHKKITQTFIPYTVPAYTTKRKHKICLNGINYVVLKNITMGKSVWATQFLSFILYYFHFHFSLLACLLTYLLCIVKGKETLGIYLILSVLCLSEIGLEMRYNKGNENSKKKKISSR